MKKLIAPLIVGALVIGGGSFYGGMQYQKSQATNQFVRGAGGGQFRAFGNGQGGAGGRNGGGFTTGEVVAKDANSLTVKLRDNSSKVVFYSSSTTVGKMAAGTADDVTQGTQVMVAGTANSDGSIAASSIQIRPAMPQDQGTNPTPAAK